MTVLPTTDVVARPRQQGYEARLDELLLRLAITPDSQIEQQVVPPQAPRIQLGGALEALPSSALIASVGDVSGGEGLHNTSRARTERDSTRYWASRGIDTSAAGANSPGGFTLLRGTKQVHASITATTPYLVVLDDKVLMADGPNVKTIASVFGSPSPTTEDPFTGSTSPLTGLARIGGDVWASMNAANGLSKRAAGGSTWAVTGTLANIIGLWSAKQRLFALIGNVFHEINQTTGASLATVLTLPVGRIVTAVADAGDVILVSDNTGKVYSFALDASAVLVLKSETKVGLADTEVTTCLASGFGVAVIGTKETTSLGGTIGRLYVANITAADSGHRLVDMQLVKEFPSESLTEARHPTAITFRQASAYVAVISDGEVVLWRYQLATGGLSEDLVFPIEVVPYGIGVIENRLVVGLAASGLWGEADTFVSSGYLMSPLSNFGFATAKTWAWVNFLGLGLGSGATVRISLTSNPDALLSPDHVDWRPVLDLYDMAAEGDLAPVFDVKERAVAMMVTLSSGGTAAPTVTSVSVYAYPSPDELRVNLPVNISDRIERPGRAPITVGGWGNLIYRELLARRGDSTELEVYRHQLTIRGTIEDVRMASPGRGRRSSGTLVCIVTVQGRVVAIGATAFVGPTTLGVGTLGIDLLGV